MFFKTGDLLKEVQCIWNFLWGQEHGELYPFSAGDCLVEVITWEVCFPYLIVNKVSNLTDYVIPNQSVLKYNVCSEEKSEY